MGYSDVSAHTSSDHLNPNPNAAQFVYEESKMETEEENIEKMMVKQSVKEID